MKTWHVQPGDTLYRIALSHGVPLSELLVANPGLDPNNLVAGQEVVIPTTVGADLTVPSAPAESFGWWLREIHCTALPKLQG